jgi:hypothetical protein
VYHKGSHILLAFVVVHAGAIGKGKGASHPRIEVAAAQG